ncbi:MULTISPECIES: hypothetical protein [Bacillus]|uniref:UDP-N-acetylglucosamine 2-epimerase (Non-hydrolyzing) n=1 Tax=Bacillus capparidis TaxID=1840411 RepID=A0ABS4CTV0_9BACI|nr:MULTISPECIES: hypothetical protein [Bacillus]MBP1080956.1 UDP-N-acetylglucosamine 2-epimerase (non-hydrolyzing) [Bacillus capparidis]
MKVLTVVGTRPEIIRLSFIIKKLNELAEKHLLIHSGQTFTHSLYGNLFEELGIRNPYYILSTKQKS